MTCWSDLASDVLEHITSLLPLPDHHRFSAVCKNWRLVAKQKRYSPAPQLPWLVLGDECGTGKRKFYSLSEDKHYAIDIPELYGRYICGSSHGWLVAIDIKITGILINPFTREFFELPPFPPYSRFTNVTTLIEKVPNDYTGGPRKKTFEEMQVLLVHKAILSHDPRERPDFILMILVGTRGDPAFWKPGNSSWTYVIPEKKSGALMGIGRYGALINDVIYFKGKFIFLSSRNEVFFLKFQPDPKVYEIDFGIWLRHALKMHGIERLTEERPTSYLVDYLGDLLLVERLDRAIERHHYKAYQFKVIFLNFEVIEIDLDQRKPVYQWSDVGEYALFLGANASIVIDPSKVVGGKCKTNSIYFTDVYRTLPYEHFGWDDMGIFNMRDKTFNTFYCPEIRHTPVGKPIWFTPNPW